MLRTKKRASIPKDFFSALALTCSVLLFTLPGVCAEPLWTTLEHSMERKAAPLTSETIALLVERLKPAVVNISVTQIVKKTAIPQELQGTPGDSPFKDFWRKFFGSQEPRESLRRGLGSGFIINKEGYIITNNHVVRKAKGITVILHNNQQYPARIVGADIKTDIALLKIDAQGDLPVAPLGDSEVLREGESVIAIGNPFGLSETVTAGIVSAKGRVIGSGPYDDFIQTDASINPGNSGGPLINYSGEVVGINSAIVSSGQGIGFAVPINIAKDILMQLKEKGRVIRGWLGISLQEITPELAQSFDLKEIKGVLISDIVPGSPSEKAGLRRGDIVVEFNDKPINDYQDLPRAIALAAPGEKVSLKVLRDAKELNIAAVVSEMKDEEAVPQPETPEKKLGLSLQILTPDVARELGLKKPEGVVVTAVEQISPAAEAGLQRGDVILEANRKTIGSLKDFMDAVQRADRTMLLLVYRSNSTFFSSLKMHPKER